VTALSLDAEKVHALNAKEFNKLYSDYEDLWRELAGSAAAHANSFLEMNGEVVRPGDVAAVLQLSVKVNPTFEKHLQDRRLTQKYWASYFSDYIVEQIYGRPDIIPKGHL
jgi:hypothetical protein